MSSHDDIMLSDLHINNTGRPAWVFAKKHLESILLQDFLNLCPDCELDDTSDSNDSGLVVLYCPSLETFNPEGTDFKIIWEKHYPNKCVQIILLLPWKSTLDCLSVPPYWLGVNHLNKLVTSFAYKKGNKSNKEESDRKKGFPAVVERIDVLLFDIDDRTINNSIYSDINYAFGIYMYPCNRKKLSKLIEKYNRTKNIDVDIKKTVQLIIGTSVGKPFSSDENCFRYNLFMGFNKYSASEKEENTDDDLHHCIVEEHLKQLAKAFKNPKVLSLLDYNTAMDDMPSEFRLQDIIDPPHAKVSIEKSLMSFKQLLILVWLYIRKNEDGHWKHHIPNKRDVDVLINAFKHLYTEK